MDLIFASSIILLLILGGFILNILTSIWCYRDARRNGRSTEYALIILVATLFFPFIGFLVYLIIRKDRY
ncbi:PLDc N-terminal domain-containing protein [Bacillus sp. YZJH907-2]|uniref:PLDc N-terminal domain-containing protein n=2 Tax=Halalkalibacter suaedae TaxID=2822140 RepID=A0A941AQT6_9BACI|nr:PLDc N-terminal domain-containing protein [Bacillus suaedae]MBP3953172.1 PLDc N-terminal domain-containing protein [Bacillus suaedae]